MGIMISQYKDPGSLLTNQDSMECHSRVLNAAQLLNFGGVRELRPQQKHQSAPQMDLAGTFTFDLHLAGAKNTAVS